MPCRHMLAAIAVIALAFEASGAMAQSPAAAKAEGAEAGAQSRREAAQKKREARREGAEERREALREKREELGEKREQAREEAAKERERAKELRAKKASGELTEEEQKELDELREKRKERHKALIERHAKMRTPEMVQKRRRAARRALLNRWKNHDFKKPAVKNELELHARRMARLKRAEHLAIVNDRPDLLETVRSLMRKEQARHAKHMQTLSEKGS